MPSRLLWQKRNEGFCAKAVSFSERDCAWPWQLEELAAALSWALGGPGFQLESSGFRFFSGPGPPTHPGPPFFCGSLRAPTHPGPPFLCAHCPSTPGRSKKMQPGLRIVEHFQSQRRSRFVVAGFCCLALACSSLAPAGGGPGGPRMTGLGWARSPRGSPGTLPFPSPPQLRGCG